MGGTSLVLIGSALLAGALAQAPARQAPGPGDPREPAGPMIDPAPPRQSEVGRPPAPEAATERQAEQNGNGNGNATAGVPVSVAVRSALGGNFDLVRARVSIDGVTVVDRAAAAGQALTGTLPAYEARLSPGRHVVAASFTYQGRNRGPITYMDNYQLQATSTNPVEVRAGEPLQVVLVADRRAGFNVPVEQQPLIRVELGPAGR